MLKLGEFEGYTDKQLKGDVCDMFACSSSEMNKYKILIAQLWSEQYEESAWFLVKNKENGQLQEVNAGHCSCYGFEGQWEPTDTSKAYILSDKFYACGVDKERVQKYVKQYC